MHVFRLKGGEITGLHIYCDTQLLAEICRTLGEEGVTEAVAAPIGAISPPLGCESRGCLSNFDALLFVDNID